MALTRSRRGRPSDECGATEKGRESELVVETKRTRKTLGGKGRYKGRQRGAGVVQLSEWMIYLWCNQLLSVQSIIFFASQIISHDADFVLGGI